MLSATYYECVSEYDDFSNSVEGNTNGVGLYYMSRSNVLKLSGAPWGASMVRGGGGVGWFV
jgi:hypothetical protein